MDEIRRETEEPVSDIISYPVCMDQALIYWCSFNPGVNCCTKDKCNSCGWNPAVSRARAAKIRKYVETYGVTFSG